MRKALVHLLALSLVCAVCLPLTTVTSSAQQSLGALERGYRAGYSDGYGAGYHDTAQRQPYNFRNKQDFRKADRAYVAIYGTLEDYRDGYQQGFAVGYNDGFVGSGFNSTIPKNMTAKGTVDQDGGSATSAGSSPSGGSSSSIDDPSTSADSGGSSTSSGTTDIPDDPAGTASSTSGGVRPVGPPPAAIPDNTLLLVEMLDDVTTERSQKGQQFQARVIEPAEFEGALLDGHIENIQRPGRSKGTAKLQLSFDTIRIDKSGDVRIIKAQVVEIVAMNPGDKVESVDSEGGVKGRATKTADMVKIGVGTAVGAVIGAIFGGGKGAAVGAAVGGGASTGSVLSSRGRDINLIRGQQLRLRTTGTTQLY